MSENTMAILEALIFITGEEGLTTEQAMQTLELSEDETVKLFLQLQDKYKQPDSGIELSQYNDHWKYLSKPFAEPYARKLFADNKTSRLSQAALETLAIVAYKQPITRVEIEEIRGVASDVMLRKLQARNLIQEGGRSEAPGRPILYTTTDEFLDTFHLLSLDELPEIPEFHSENDPDKSLF